MRVHRSYGNIHHYCVFDAIPEITYEKIGSDYIGTGLDDNGNIIFSNALCYKSYGDAFGGSELSLKMKDGSIKKIKDHWFDCGSYKDHGEFIDIGAGTIEDLQNCYVYYGMNINREYFEKMLEDYYSREKEYEYDDIEKWIKMQYTWFPVKCDGIEYPFMINKNGNIVEKYSKERCYKNINQVLKVITIKTLFKNKELKKKKYIPITKLSYEDSYKRIHRIELNGLNIIKESLGISDDDEVLRIYDKNASKYMIGW